MGSEALSEIDTLLSELDGQAVKVRKFKDLISQATRIQAEIADDARSRRHRLKKLQSSATVVHALSHGENKAELHKKMNAMKAVCKETLSISPSTGSLFVRLFLGRVNVRVLQEVDRTRLRDEYNKFKSRTNIMFCLLPLLNFFVVYKLSDYWQYTNWVHILTHVWLLYYYVSLALRENILRVNGSNIRPWWIHHHYLSAFMSIVLLTWPNTELYRTFLPQFNLYCLCQGVVQLMQAQYQKKRLYIRKAIGKAGPMDVSQTETLTETPKELYLLLVFIFAVHLFQVYNGVTLGLHLSRMYESLKPWYNFREEVQAVLVAILFTVLGLVNFHQTVMVVVDKQRRKSRRRSRSRSASVASKPETPKSK